MSAASVVLAALEATGEVVCIACPGCKALVNLADELAKLALTQSTEAQQVASAEEAIFAADAVAVDALAAAKAPAPSAEVSAVATVVATTVAAVAATPPAPAPAPAAHPVAQTVVQAPGTVKSWG